MLVIVTKLTNFVLIAEIRVSRFMHISRHLVNVSVMIYSLIKYPLTGLHEVLEKLGVCWCCYLQGGSGLETGAVQKARTEGRVVLLQNGRWQEAYC